MEEGEQEEGDGGRGGGQGRCGGCMLRGGVGEVVVVVRRGVGGIRLILRE